MNKSLRPDLFKVMGQALLDLKCKPILINGVEDHVHILCEVHPTVPISNLVKIVKIETSKYLKLKFSFSRFEAWQESYSSFSVSNNQLDRIYNYIKNQEEHHAKLSSADELKNLLTEHNIEYNPKYFE